MSDAPASCEGSLIGSHKTAQNRQRRDTTTNTMNTKTLALLFLVAGADALSAAVPGQQQASIAAPPAAPAPPAGPAVQQVRQQAVLENPTVQAASYKIPKGKLAENGGTMLADRYHQVGPDDAYGSLGPLTTGPKVDYKQVGPDDAYGKKMPTSTGPRVSYDRLSPNSINSAPIGPTQAYSY